MFDSKQAGTLTNLILSLIMSILLSVVDALYTRGTLSILPFLLEVIKAWIVAFIISTVVRVGPLGRHVASFYFKNKVMHYLMDCLIVVLIMGIFMSFFLTLLSHGFSRTFFEHWYGSWVWVFPTSYIVTLFAVPATAWCVKRLVKT